MAVTTQDNGRLKLDARVRGWLSTILRATKPDVWTAETISGPHPAILATGELVHVAEPWHHEFADWEWAEIADGEEGPQWLLVFNAFGIMRAVWIADTGQDPHALTYAEFYEPERGTRVIGRRRDFVHLLWVGSALGADADRADELIAKGATRSAAPQDKGRVIWVR